MGGLIGISPRASKWLETALSPTVASLVSVKLCGLREYKNQSIKCRRH